MTTRRGPLLQPGDHGNVNSQVFRVVEGDRFWTALLIVKSGDPNSSNICMSHVVQYVRYNGGFGWCMLQFNIVSHEFIRGLG